MPGASDSKRWRTDMNRSLVSLCAAVLIGIIFDIAGSVHAQPVLPCTRGSLPSNDPEYPANQLILTCVPPGWNGDLVVYARGFVPPQAPLVLPTDASMLPDGSVIPAELTLPDGTFIPAGILAQGFAFATSSYHKNGAFTEQGTRDILDLVKYFETVVGPGALKRVFIIGGSEGGLVAMQLLEQHADVFSAGLAVCAPVGGGPRQIKYFEDFRVVFDYFFPRVFPFRAFNVPADAFVSWDSVYVPQIVAAMTSNPRATAQLFSVTRAAVDPTNLETAAQTAVETALDVLFYSIWETPDLIATTGGIPYDNRFTLYLGLTNNLALNLGVERVRGDREAERYAQMFYQTTGNLKRPLVTLHNTLDPIVPFDHEFIYSGLVALQRKSRFLNVLPVKSYGHCNFTANEIFDAFGLMLHQVNVQTP
jgi:pimeloyl-ACP methyl ester carboxylesterase